ADRHHQAVAESIDGLAAVSLREQAALDEQPLRESLFQQPALEPVARQRRKPQAELIDRRRADAALPELLARARAGRRRELLAEIRGGDLVDLEQRFAQAGVVVSGALASLGQRHAEFLREHLHGFGKVDLLVQLEELEHIAADAAA